MAANLRVEATPRREVASVVVNPKDPLGLEGNDDLDLLEPVDIQIGGRQGSLLTQRPFSGPPLSLRVCSLLFTSPELNLIIDRQIIIMDSQQQNN